MALPEVLQFLALSRKTGVLHVQGSRAEGSLWFSEGAISGAAVDSSPDLIEALFQLLRVVEGEFDFVSEDIGSPEMSCEPTSVEELLEPAQARLEEWDSITAVVPSLEHRLRLAAAAPTDTVQLTAQQWSLVVGIGEGRSVGDLLVHHGLGEFDGCKAVKDLVETCLVDIEEPPVGAAGDEEGQDGWSPLDDDRADPWTEFAVYAPGESNHSEPGDDPYAALKAAIASVDDDQVDELPEDRAEDPEDPAEMDVPVWDPDAQTEERSALRSLLEEVISAPGPEPFDAMAEATSDMPDRSRDPVLDGLADRGPWPADELAALVQAEVEAEAEAEAEQEADAEPESETTDVLEEEEQLEDRGGARESIDRGLLLRFLSSVRE